ncbi:MAG: hypothetical protein KJO08_10965 [Gammaproteobacteria bacterium]|nr:hypothetical protein [Gammaproteobacteria bacterium]NNJ84565.1 hypothetical protein [Gammaproteobacteria bacterium]
MDESPKREDATLLDAITANARVFSSSSRRFPARYPGMVAVPIMDYCGRKGIAIPEKGSRFDDERQQPVKHMREKGRKRRDGDE